MRSLSLSSSFFLSSHLLYSTLLYSVTVRRIKVIDRHHMLSCKSNNFWIKKSERKHRRIKKMKKEEEKLNWYWYRNIQLFILLEQIFVSPTWTRKLKRLWSYWWNLLNLLLFHYMFIRHVIAFTLFYGILLPLI